MYADVVFQAGGEEGAVTAVPDSAVIDSGTRQVVLVAKGEGRFEPRAVKLGRRGEGYVEITRRSEAGRGRRDLGELPDRRREQSESRAANLQPAGDAAMIAALIRWSARNVFLVGLGDGLRRRSPASTRSRACRSTPFPTSPTLR